MTTISTEHLMNDHVRAKQAELLALDERRKSATTTERKRVDLELEVTQFEADLALLSDAQRFGRALADAIAPAGAVLDPIVERLASAQKRIRDMGEKLGADLHDPALAHLQGRLQNIRNTVPSDIATHFTRDALAHAFSLEAERANAVARGRARQNGER